MDRANSLTDNGSSHLLKSPSSVVISTLSTHATSGADADPRADEDIISKPRGFFADQFEVGETYPSSPASYLTHAYIQNKSNFDAHFDGTGPEIWRQTDGRVDAFVSGAGAHGVSLHTRFTSSRFDRDGGNNSWRWAVPEVHERGRHRGVGRSRGQRVV